MPNSLGQCHIWSCAPFCTWIFTRKLTVGYNYAIFLNKNYISRDNTLVVMPSSLGQDGVMPLVVLAFLYRQYRRSIQVFN
jgi:ERCC4-related helicase